MKLTARSIACCLRASIVALGAGFLFSQAAAQTLTFSPMPMEKPEIIANQWRPVLDYLEKALGSKLRISYPASNAEIVDRFHKGEIDLAYLGPLPYMELKKAFADAVPVVKIIEADDQAQYTCAIIALAEHKLTVKALRGKTIALTQPMSTCGYLATDGMLHQAGSDLEHNRFRYVGAHDKVAIAVARGDFDAGGVKTTIGQRYQHLGVQVIAESTEFPSFALIANARRLSVQQIDKIRTALIATDGAVRAGWGVMQQGVVAADDHDYDNLRSYGTYEPIPQQGNY